MKGAKHEPLRAELAAARKVEFPHSNLMFEFTENERMTDVAHVQKIVEAYRYVEAGQKIGNVILTSNYSLPGSQTNNLLVTGISECGRFLSTPENCSSRSPVSRELQNLRAWQDAQSHGVGSA